METIYVQNISILTVHKNTYRSIKKVQIKPQEKWAKARHRHTTEEETLMINNLFKENIVLVIREMQN